MENIAPNIFRQRLLIEGFYTANIQESEIKLFLTELAKKLNLRYYGEPIVHTACGLGKEENDGFDAFLPLIDSGISLYVWTKEKFFAAILFTCKEFNSEEAIEFVKKYFVVSKIVCKNF